MHAKSRAGRLVRLYLISFALRVIISCLWQPGLKQAEIRWYLQKTKSRQCQIVQKYRALCLANNGEPNTHSVSASTIIAHQVQLICVRTLYCILVTWLSFPLHH